MLREIKGSQRLSRFLGFKVTGSGTAAINQGAADAALTDNGVGDWTLTFTKPFARAPIPVGNCLTALAYLEFSVVSATAIRILAKKTSDNSAIDAVFFCHVLGYDSADET